MLAFPVNKHKRILYIAELQHSKNIVIFLEIYISTIFTMDIWYVIFVILTIHLLYALKNASFSASFLYIRYVA